MRSQRKILRNQRTCINEISEKETRRITQRIGHLKSELNAKEDEVSRKELENQEPASRK